jgi:hypothetical protein
MLPPFSGQKSKELTVWSRLLQKTIVNPICYTNRPFIHIDFPILTTTKLTRRNVPEDTNLNRHLRESPTLWCSGEQTGVACTLWTCIREVLNSNLGRDTGYPNCVFSWISSVPADKYWDNISIGPRLLPPKIHSNSLFTKHPTIRRYTARFRKVGSNV